MTLTELKRMRRGFTGWFVIIAPSVATIPLYLVSLFSPEARSGKTWQVFRDVSLEGWGILIPMTAALLAALTVRADTDAWRILLSYAVPRPRYFTAKFLALAAMTSASTAVLGVLLAGGAALNGALGENATQILQACLLPWLAGLGGTALALFVAVVWGLGPTISLGVFGMMSGMLISDKDWWWAVPFAWPMRVVLPLAGIGPNGVPLRADSPLRDRGVIPVAIALSFALLAAVWVAGSVHLKRKEI
ncbi:MAG: lantibiotic transport system permease protein [Actinomycetota bacterium]|nr:lantibiotic transport system permease protein [Actinomycetota bacterium]